MVKEYLATQNDVVLRPGQDLVWSVEGEEDIVLATNGNNFDVVVEQKHPRVALGKPTYKGNVRSIVVNVACKAHEFRYNLKARNGLTKGMTYVKPIELRCEGEVVKEWDMVLTPETNKGAINTLSAFASRFIDAENSTAVNVVFDAKTGDLDFDGADIATACENYLGISGVSSAMEAYSLYVEQNTKTFTIKEVVDVSVVEKFKDFQNNKVQFVKEDNVWYLIEKFNGILDYTFPLWEVSTPAECAGTNSMDVDAQSVASLYDPGVKAKLVEMQKKSVKNLAMFELDEKGGFANVDVVFDISN